MFGPGISDPTKIVNRDVPKCDVQAYKAAGYQIGSIKEDPIVASDEVHSDGTPKVTYTEKDAVAQAEKAPKKGKK